MTSKTRYRLIAGTMVLALVVAASSALVGQTVIAVLALSISFACLGTLVYLVKCSSCGVLPASRIFWFWLMFLDVGFFISDILFLNRCPKCKGDPFFREKGG